MEFAQAFLRVLVLLFCGLVREAFFEQGNGGVDFATLPCSQSYAEHFPNIGHGFEMIPFISKQMDETNDSPALKFLEASAYV